MSPKEQPKWFPPETEKAKATESYSELLKRIADALEGINEKFAVYLSRG